MCSTFIYASDEPPISFTHAEFGVPIKDVPARAVEMLRRIMREQDDLRYQAMQNNLWGNNPGELERWADDGGRNVD